MATPNSQPSPSVKGPTARKSVAMQPTANGQGAFVSATGVSATGVATPPPGSLTTPAAAGETFEMDVTLESNRAHGATTRTAAPNTNPGTGTGTEGEKPKGGERPVDFEPSQPAVTMTLDAEFSQATNTPSGANGAKAAHPTQSLRRYEIQGELARGGMGAILVAKDRDLRRDVAMKVLLDPSQPVDDGKTRARLGRFLEEAQITGQLEHPNIVPVHEIGMDSHGHWYFTMKLVNGEALSDILRKLKSQPSGAAAYKGFTRSRLLDVYGKICDAVAYAHSRGVVHRDLKPANVMVGAFGEVLVMDWGIAKILNKDATKAIKESRRTMRNSSVGVDTARAAAPDPADPAARTFLSAGTLGASAEVVSSRVEDGGARTLDGTVVGTPAYMAPEQARGEIDQISERTDIYALGAMLYEILCGEAPYQGRSALEILSQVQSNKPPMPLSSRAKGHDAPAELGAIALHAMHKNWRKRYPTVADLRADIDRYREGLPISVYRESSWSCTKKWIWRNKLQTAIIAATLTIAVTVAISLGITVQAQNESLAAQEATSAAQAREGAANLNAKTLAWALNELDRVHTNVRSGADLNQALADVQQVRAKAPVLYPAIFEHSDILFRLGRRDDASKVLVTLRDDDTAPKNFRAQAAYLIGLRKMDYAVLPNMKSVDDLKASVLDFQQARSLAEANTPTAYATKALEAMAAAGVMNDGKARDEALKVIRECAEACPTMWEPWYALARVNALPVPAAARREGRFGGALAMVYSMCEHVLKLQPGQLATRRLLASLSMDTAELAELCAIQPDSPALQILSAQAQRLGGATPKNIVAISALSKSGNAWATLELAECLRHAGNYVAAMAQANLAIAQLPSEAAPFLCRARIRMAMNVNANTQEILKDLLLAVYQDPRDPAVLGMRGLMEARAGRLAEANAALTAYITNWPPAVAAYDARGRVLLAMGNLKDALADWQQVVRLEPDRFNTWALIYRTLGACNRFAEAFQAYNHAYACAPPELHQALEDDREEMYERQLILTQYGADQQVPKEQIAYIGGQLLGANLPQSLFSELSGSETDLIRARKFSRVPGTVISAEAEELVLRAAGRAANNYSGKQRVIIAGAAQGGAAGDAMRKNPGESPDSEVKLRPGSPFWPFDSGTPGDKELEKWLKQMEQGDPGQENNPDKKKPQGDSAKNDEQARIDDFRNQFGGQVQRRQIAGASNMGQQGQQLANPGQPGTAANPAAPQAVKPATSKLGDMALHMVDKERAQEIVAAVTPMIERFEAMSGTGDFDRVQQARGALLLQRAEAYRELELWWLAAQDFDMARDNWPLSSMRAYCAGEAYARLAMQEPKPDGAPDKGECLRNALKYLEDAVRKQLPDRDRLLAFPAFEPLKENARFKKLLAHK